MTTELRSERIGIGPVGRTATFEVKKKSHQETTRLQALDAGLDVCIALLRSYRTKASMFNDDIEAFAVLLMEIQEVTFMYLNTESVVNSLPRQFTCHGG
tara:strand:- start:119 stop:415 length:297 start_codon:yes stop_codon:yes gene_type:complete